MKKLLRNKWLWAGVSVLLLWAAFSGTFAYAPAIEGRVIDAETGRPIPNARVRAVWGGTRAAPPVDRLSAIQDVTVSRSDQNGHFTINALWKRLDVPVLDQAGVRGVDVFAHGYTIGRSRASGSSKPTIELQRISSDFKFLDHLREVDTELDASFRVRSLWPSVARGDQSWLLGEWQTFFRAFPHGPATQQLKDRLERGGLTVEIVDGASAVIRQAPDAPEARSATLWLRLVNDLTKGPNPPERESHD